MESLGERIREVRGSLRLPRAEFALLIGVSPTALFNYESGDRVPGADILIRICEATHANPQWLLMGTGPTYDTDYPELYKDAAAAISSWVADVLKITIQKKDKILLEGVVEEIIKFYMSGKDIFEDINEFLSEYSDKKAKIIEFPQKQRKSNTQRSVSQNAKGNNIVQTTGDIHGGINIKTTTKNVNVEVQPPQGTIGANASLMERIQTLFNELGLRREERFGKTAYPVMYNEFKKAFNIPKNQKYTAYQLWPESRGQEIINYIEDKLSNTIKGRIQKAASRKRNTVYDLLSETSRLHKMLGWGEQEYRARLHYLFGVTSRKELSALQLANYVAYLGEQVDERD